MSSGGPPSLADAVAGLEPSLIREMSRRRRATTLNLTLGQPARGPDPDLLERALEAQRSGPPGYTENAGLLELRQRIAEHHGRAGHEEVIVTCGSEQAVYLALSAILSPGDEVLIPDPGYPAYRGIVNVLHGLPVTYPVTPDGGLVPQLDDLCARATPRTKAVLWNTPSNPFGTSPDASSTRALEAEAAARGWWILSDEIYRDLRYGASWTAPRGPQVLTISGLSKSCALTGFRMGYICGPSSFVAPATLLNQLMVTCAPRLSQLMALEVFAEPERLTAHLPDYAAARAAVQAAAGDLPENCLHLGDGAFYAVLDVRPWLEGRGTLAWALDLLEAEDVAVVPGVAFGPSGDWFVRLSYAGGAEVAAEGIRRIARYLRAAG